MNDDDIQHFYETILSTFELGNYDVKYEVLPRSEMDDKLTDGTRNDGLLFVDPKHEVADIYLCNDLDNNDNWPKIPEVVLLHEFIHLLMYEFDSYVSAKYPDTEKDDHFNTLEEQFINRLSRSIWSLIQGCKR